MEGRPKLVAFKRNCVKLAWAFINIMNVGYHCKILHNNFSKDNIMLHFLVDELDVVYISMCDYCCDPSLGFTTKVRVCEGVGQE